MFTKWTQHGGSDESGSAKLVHKENELSRVVRRNLRCDYASASLSFILFVPDCSMLFDCARKKIRKMQQKSVNFLHRNFDVFGVTNCTRQHQPKNRTAFVGIYYL